ncbi:MAG: hypothetical protein WDN30_15880 [Pararobbsia sp.]
MYAAGPTRIVPLDLSAELGCPSPATGPGLSASFLRINTGERLTLAPNATSQVCYVISGAGEARQGGTAFPFAAGDFFTLPGELAATLSAEASATLYYVNDAPLLTYLGVTASRHASRRRSTRPREPRPSCAKCSKMPTRAGATASASCSATRTFRRRAPSRNRCGRCSAS